MRIDYNQITGMLEGTSVSSDYFSDATLFTSMEAGACVAIIEYSALQLRSTYNNDYSTRANPTIDSVILTSGLAGQQVKMARLKGMQYSFDEPILNSSLLTSDIYLDKQGKLSLIEPTLLNGDRWYVYVGRKINDYSFIFDPHPPLDLQNILGGIHPSPYPDHTLDKVTISEAMPALTCFKIESDGLAYKIKANDLITPFIDGITLENGSANQEIFVARLKNQIYTTPFFFTSNNIYFLNNLGQITNPRASNVIYSCIVGRSVANSNSFIFDPQPPIKLA